MSEDGLIFQEVLTAIQNGDKARARDLLSRLIKNEKNNAQYWLKLCSVVETKKERIFCLREVIRLEPENQSARRGLILFGEMPADESLAIPIKAQVRDWQSSLFSNPITEKMLRRNQMRTIATFILAIVMFGAVVAAIGISLSQAGNNLNASPVEATPTYGIFPTAQAAATLTNRAITPIPGNLSSLGGLLVATYTSTPLSVNTPHPRTEAYRSAIFAYQRGDWNGAIGYLQQVTTVEPTAADVFYLMGDVYRIQNKLKEASSAYDQAIKVNPNFAPAYLGRARTRLVTNPEPTELIRADLEKTISLDPNLGEAYMELASLKIRKKETKDLLRDLDFAARLLPGSPQVFLLRSQYFLGQAKPEAALEDAQRAYALDLTNLQVYRTLGEAYRANKKLIESIQPLEVFTNYSITDPEPFVWLAQAYLERKTSSDLQFALKALDKALLINNFNYEGHILRGNLFLDLDKPKEALTDFEVAGMLRADSFQAMLGKGRVMLKLDSGSEAYNFFSRALPLAANNAERAAAFYWRAVGLEQLKLIPSALADWDALLKLPTVEVPALYRETALQHVQMFATPTRTPMPLVTLTPSISLSVTLTPGTSPTPSLAPAISLTITPP